MGGIWGSHSELVSESVFCSSPVFNLTVCRVGDGNQRAAAADRLLEPHGAPPSRLIFKTLLMKVQNIRCEARLLLRKVKGVILTIAESFTFPSMD